MGEGHADTQSYRALAGAGSMGTAYRYDSEHSTNSSLKQIRQKVNSGPSNSLFLHGEQLPGHSSSSHSRQTAVLLGADPAVERGRCPREGWSPLPPGRNRWPEEGSTVVISELKRNLFKWCFLKRQDDLHQFTS